jgi:hypothetical protein
VEVCDHAVVALAIEAARATLPEECGLAPFRSLFVGHEAFPAEENSRSSGAVILKSNVKRTVRLEEGGRVVKEFHDPRHARRDVQRAIHEFDMLLAFYTSGLPVVVPLELHPHPPPMRPV